MSQASNEESETAVSDPATSESLSQSTVPATPSSAVDSRVQGNYLETYQRVREFSRTIAEPLSPEDCSIQSMEDASPTRWHLAHTTWFFETFLLKSLDGYERFDDRFEYLFNSYYNTVGQQYPRSQRGLISRPNLQDTLDYRRHVDRHISDWMVHAELSDQQKSVLITGIQHEQQHQELMLTDLKDALSRNPMDPVYRKGNQGSESDFAGPQSWVQFDASIAWIGHSGNGFSFDNERPRHRVFLEPFEIAGRCVTNREYKEFIEDGGYQRPELWLSMGWDTVQRLGWQAPLYWRREPSSEWSMFTLSGRRPVHPDQPVCHVSYFEADAFARWSGCRLATEFEWEHAVNQTSDSLSRAPGDGVWSDHLIGSGESVHPRVAGNLSGIENFERAGSKGAGPKTSSGEETLKAAMGNVWEWTSSHYSAYPGYSAPEGALGEYNGKFMCNVFVLKGGSCATPSNHARPSYRNFFSPESRWQFSGIRLARSV